jgi:hypothetical protein
MALKDRLGLEKNKDSEINMKTSIWEGIQGFTHYIKMIKRKQATMRPSCKELTRCIMPKIHQFESSFNRPNKKNRLNKICPK